MSILQQAVIRPRAEKIVESGDSIPARKRQLSFYSNSDCAALNANRYLPGPARDFLVGHDHVAIVEPHPSGGSELI